nr:exo-alpha-sialidase [uncultured Dorea sp.]
MKNMKKALALFLVVCMTLGMTLSVSATEASAPDSEDAAKVVSEESDATDETTDLNAEESQEMSEQQTDDIATVDVKMAQKPADGTNAGQPFPTNIGVGHYRIPAFTTLNNGTLVAAADARWGAWQKPDDCANIETIVSRSTDNGANWNYTFANYIADEQNARDFKAATFIDPALATNGSTIYMIADLFPGQAGSQNCSQAAQTGSGMDSNGNLLLKKPNESGYNYYLKDGAIYKVSDNSQVSGYSVDKYFNLLQNGTVLGNLFTYSTTYFQPLMTSYLCFTTSTDGGATWSAPRLLNLKNSTEKDYLISPGRGLVASDGTIVFPCYTYSGSKMSLIYSKDGGSTWTRTSDVSFNSSEGDIVELADGTLRYFYRHSGWDTASLRYVDITGNGTSGYTFGKEVTVSGVSVYSDCNLSAITYSKTVDGKQVIFVSCPTSNRTTGKIFTFTVEANNQLKLADTYSVNGSSAFSYSSLTEQQDGSIGILYEKGDSGNITYANLAVDKVAPNVTFDNGSNSGGNNGSNGNNGTEVTKTENVKLYVGQEKTYTIKDYDYAGNISDYDKNIADVKAEYQSTEAVKSTEAVSEIESGKSYLIVNSSTNTLLTSTISSKQDNFGAPWNGLKIDGALSADSTELWTVTQTSDGYSLKNAAGQYLSISSHNATLGSEESTLRMRYTSGHWEISQKNGWYYYNLYNYTGIATGSYSYSSNWDLYEIKSTEGFSGTSVSVKGISEGQTTVTVGNTTYNITVLKMPEVVNQEITPFVGGSGQGKGQKLTGLIISAGTSYNVDLADNKSATSWTSADETIATVDETGKVTGVAPGQTTVTAVIDGVKYKIPVTVIAGATTNTNSVDVYNSKVTNCTAYYSLNSGDLTEFPVGTQVYVKYNKNNTQLISFFAKPDNGYALTYVNSDGGTYFHSVRNEDGTSFGEEYDDTNSTQKKGGYNYVHDQLIAYVVNNSGSKAATVDQVHKMLNNAVELKCDGAFFFSRGKNSSTKIETVTTFIAEKLPTVEKTVAKVNGDPYVAGQTQIHENDTITFDVKVTQYAPSETYKGNAIKYTNKNLKENLANATFSGNATKVTPELSDSAVENDTTKTYEVTYKVTPDDLDTKITNTVDLTYTYQSEYSKGSFKSAAKAEAAVSVLSGTPDDVVIDFGLPVTVDCTDITSYDFQAGKATYGTVTVAGKKATYTPNQVLTNVDTVTLTNVKGAEYTFKVYPATTVYYEESFATPVKGFVQSGIVSGNQQSAVPGVAENYNYGFDKKYADETTGSSAGTQMTSSAMGDSAEFSFTGTGVDVYANTTPTSGTVSIKVKKDGVLKKLISVDTSMKVGSSKFTEGQNVKAYNVPIASIDMKEYGNYTLTITQTKSKNADCDHIVNIDGFRVYNTLNTDEATTVYAKDGEANPTYTEVRNHVLKALNVESVIGESQYANQIAGNIYSQIYESGDAEGGAVILDSATNTYTGGNVQDLLDNGPKNELYLYPNQILTFKLNAEAQIGLKALDRTVTYVINDETKNLTSSTDMFYQATAGTVTIKNTGTGILSITKVKATDPTNAEKLFAMLTADDFMPALLSLGYETEKPMADATANLNLVDYTGKTIASTSLTANGEQGTDATFTADQIKSAVTSALPEGYAVVDASKIADQTVKYGESADVNVQIGKVATLKVTYKKLFGKTVGTATLTGVQTSAGSKYSFSASEIKKAVPSGYWTIKLWGTKVKYGTTGTLTVNVF